MKRLILSVILLISIVVISALTLVNLYLYKEEVLTRVDELRSSAQNPDREVLMAKSKELFERWDKQEQILVLHIRHNTLDEISKLLAELPALAEFEDYAAFYGRLDVVAALMNDLWRSNVPSYRTLL